jgi:hypothetical protein
MKANRSEILKDLPWGFNDEFFLTAEGKNTLDHAASLMREGHDAKEAWSLAHQKYVEEIDCMARAGTMGERAFPKWKAYSSFWGR